MHHQGAQRGCPRMDVWTDGRRDAAVEDDFSSLNKLESLTIDYQGKVICVLNQELWYACVGVALFHVTGG